MTRLPCSNATGAYEKASARIICVRLLACVRETERQSDRPTKCPFLFYSNSSWFATPLSLLILANTRADRMRPWMWFVLFGIIAIWNVVGLLLMYVLHPVPLYNIIKNDADA